MPAYHRQFAIISVSQSGVFTVTVILSYHSLESEVLGSLNVLRHLLDLRHVELGRVVAEGAVRVGWGEVGPDEKQGATTH